MRTGRLRTGWEGHLLLPYASASELALGVTTWAQDGLDQREGLVCAEHPGRAGIRGRLRNLDVPAAREGSTAALEVVTEEDAADLAVPQRLRERLERALRAGFRGLRVCLEILPSAPDVCRELAAAVDQLGAVGRVGILCRYDRAAGGRDLELLVASHPGGLRTAMLTTRPVGDGLALAGEVDISNVALFGAALSHASRVPRGVLWLDMTDLRFMDVSACRELASTTRGFRNNGGTVLLVDPLPPVAHVLELLGLDRLRGIDLLGR